MVWHFGGAWIAYKRLAHGPNPVYVSVLLMRNKIAIQRLAISI